MKVIEACLYVSDIDKAEEFYTNLLGVKPFAKAKNRHVFYKLENCMFLIFNPEYTKIGGDVPPHGYYGHGHIAFAVSDGEIELWKEKIKSLGIEIEAEVLWPSGGKSVYIRDPFGNSVEFITPEAWGFNWKDCTNL
ncbi:MAG: VOC family protein [candidate division WOR-3 bacterium]